jgi:formyl-CoA transferase
MLAALEPKFWANFCKAVGRRALIQNHGTSIMDYGLVEGLRHETHAIFFTRTVDEPMDLAREWDNPICPALEDHGGVADGPVFVRNRSSDKLFCRRAVAGVGRAC